jgi:muconolactone delta-isomerase
MANLDELQKQHEARLDAFIQELSREGRESDLALARALIHRGVHLAIDRRAGEFCAVATFLCDMVGHAHGLMHGADPGSGNHDDVVH